MRPLLVVLVALAMLCAAASTALAAPAGDPQRGGKLLAKKGCTSCHSTDGSARVGPTFRGLYASSRTVTTAGAEGKLATRTTIADDAYIARALREPDADVLLGFPRGVMPKYELDDEDAASIARAIEALAVPEGANPFTPTAAPPPQPSTTAMPLLAVYGVWFVGLHLLLSSANVRKKLVARLGAGRFAALYSVCAAIGLIGMILSYRSAPYVEVWLPPRAFRWAPVLAMPIAILFLIAGFSTKSATTVGTADVAADPDAARGIFTITRHPALWGFTLWASAHLLVNGELRAILVFVAILVLAVAGMLHIDRRRAAELGDTWEAYRSKTSLVPFGAIIRRKNRLDLKGIGIVRVLAAAFVYVAVLHMHALVIGASPMP
ncbi:MAG: hypothetical protein QOI41_500 [Myxococcales bacterium]|nr:hypothetical protein [Myxococcales bacterium]